MKIVPKSKKKKTAQDNRYFKRKKETNSNTSMYHQQQKRQQYCYSGFFAQTVRFVVSEFCSASIYMKLCLAFRCSRRGCCWCCCRRCCRPVKRFNSCGSRPQHTHPINTLDVDVFSFIQYSLTNWLNFFFGGCGHDVVGSNAFGTFFSLCLYHRVHRPSVV